MISITPQGIISFISNGLGGRVSDKYIVEILGYLRHLTGDVVLSDRGFDVADNVALQEATLDVPAFTRGCDQLSPGDIEATHKLANIRIHIGRIIGINNFIILLIRIHSENSVSLIRLHLEYACPNWDPFTAKDCDLLESVQRFAGRVCLKTWNCDYSATLSSLNLSNLQASSKVLKLSLLSIMWRFSQRPP